VVPGQAGVRGVYSSSALILTFGVCYVLAWNAGFRNAVYFGTGRRRAVARVRAKG
jgi:hypothetical protein